ncbi:MAG: hypothetical protein M1833_002551 [Piccolia ochrophora]|nr:MAG: hypothetical protein M1833_002551 [Piccolia ochrophora]
MSQSAIPQLGGEILIQHRSSDPPLARLKDASSPRPVSSEHAALAVQATERQPGMHSPNAPSSLQEVHDLDGQLGIYGELDHHEISSGSNDFGDYGKPIQYENDHIDGDFGAATASLKDWYDSLHYGLPEFMDGFNEETQAQTKVLPRKRKRASPVAPLGPSETSQIKGRGKKLQAGREQNAHGTSGGAPQSHTNGLGQPSGNRKGLQEPLSPHPVFKRLSPKRTDLPTKDASHSSTRTIPENSSTKSRDEFRPRTSIPSHLLPTIYAEQCILAAYSSRLNPFALHAEEYELLRDHINHLHVTSYLNIRNGILRLWIRNPLVSVTSEEAAGCAKDYRWFDVADVCYTWLVRKGYINFGCVEVPSALATPITTPSLEEKPRRKRVVILGAGMSGLGCARQLEGLFNHFGGHWTAKGEDIPEVIVLEGRQRIGGRVYSHPLRTQEGGNLLLGLRSTADMGAQIITGFDHGNPLSAIIRGQLALHYHALRDNSVLYDTNGYPVDKDRDQMVEKLFNDILDRVSIYRHKVPVAAPIEGDKELIELGRDPTGEGGKLIRVLEDAAAPLPVAGSGEQSTRNGFVEQVPAGLDKLTGKAHLMTGIPSKVPAAEAARAIGWTLRTGISKDTSLDLDRLARSANHPSLGHIMDEALKQYQELIQLTSQDMRLLNWHFANLEYANAANVGDLSLGGWDQDIGNEFDGEHAQIIGGYQQVPRGIWQFPVKLDVRTRKVVKRISYHPEASLGKLLAQVETEDGDVIDADRIVSTLPLGVLKEKAIQFQPPLPSWKEGALERLGYGLLNKVICPFDNSRSLWTNVNWIKVILVYEKPFWDEERDMFGLLRDSVTEGSLDQSEYAPHRGRFYLFWNCMKTSGRPILSALMAGDAAHETEMRTDDDIVAEAANVLKKIFPNNDIPQPSEVVISRWGRDRFARGTYSYVGCEAKPDDYDTMARPVGNLYFGGEATCGTHPATVHGAYLSGLRVASEVVESFLGPIKIPTPLVPPKSQPEVMPLSAGNRHKTEESASQKAENLKEAQLLAYETELSMAVYERFGERPMKPGKSGANPFLLYQKDQWYKCKAKCDEVRKDATGNLEAKASRNEVRAALGQMWRDASDFEKRPYLEQTAKHRETNNASAADYTEKAKQWDKDVEAFRKEYRDKHPNPFVEGREGHAQDSQLDRGSGRRRSKKVGTYVEPSGSEAES